MNRWVLILAAPLAVLVIGAVMIAVWFFEPRTDQLQHRLPGQGKSIAPPETVTPAADLNTGTLILGPGTPSAIAGSWPCFRGPDRSNVVRNAGSLLRRWPAEGPEILWRLELGEGHAGAAIHAGRVYVDDYDHEKQEDAIRCLSLDDAAEIWRYTYSLKVKRNHGMSRTIPAVNDEYLVALDPKCNVHCLNAVSGELIWEMDLVSDFGTEVPPWYAGQCPLVDGDRVILAPGGPEALLMAVEMSTGRIIWKTPNPHGWKMTHVSIVPFEYRGVRQYIYCSTGGVVSVAADDGRILWESTDWVIKLATVPSPVVVDEERIFLSGGYNSGAMLIRLTGSADAPQAEQIFRLKASVFGVEQQTPILYEDHIYGIRSGGELTCLDLDGNRLWTSGPNNRFGLGPLLIADGLIYALNDQDGTLHLVQATPTGYNELDKVELLQGHDAWAPMAMVAGRLILRDLTEMICVRIGGQD